MKVKKLLKKINYFPRWAWYMLSMMVGGPIGALIAYFAFHALERMAHDEEEEEEARAREKAWNTYAHTQHTGYRDEECVVSDESDDEIRSEWERTAASARRAQSTEGKAARETQDAPQDESDLSAVVSEVTDALRKIRHANDLIPDPALSAQIDSIENSCSQILSILKQRPQLLPELRSFLRYYLPTTLKLLDARAKLESTANTPKAREVRTRISEALGVVDKAFLKQVEALDEYRFIDLESEIDVLRDMLRADGYIEEEKEEDPFSDVLSSRGGKPIGGH